MRRRGRATPTYTLFLAACLLLGLAGRAGLDTAGGDAGQEVFLARPSREVRDARAAVPTPRNPVYARPPSSVYGCAESPHQ